MTELAQYCHDADFNVSTQTCAAPYWGPVSTGLPPLSVTDAQSISVAIGTVWALAWAFRRLNRFISTFH
jgi:hypothetical protein